MENKFTLSENEINIENKPNKPLPKVLYIVVSAVLILAVFLFVGFFVLDRFYFKDKQVETAVEVGKSVKMGENTNAVKEYASPINGVFYTKEEYDLFKDRRPLAVMVNNHVDARPQYGVNSADIVFEAVAEGGITRLMPVFYAKDAEKVGPVRSARVHFIDLAAEFSSWYAHWGGAYAPTLPSGLKDYAETNEKADAYQHINDVSLASLDQAWLGETAYYRDTSRNVALEHTGFTGTPALYKEAPNRYPEEGWTKFIKFRTWQFKDDSKLADRGSVSSVKFNFWSDPSFEVEWKYNVGTNDYTRYQGGEKIIDALDTKETKAKDVIVQFVKETSAEDKKNHLLYDIVGSGTAKVFMDGKIMNVIWKKAAIRDRTLFYEESGAEVKFNRGQIWVEIVPDRNVDTLIIGTSAQN